MYKHNLIHIQHQH